MSIGAIMTMGLGGFGTVNLIPTLGYTPGAAVAVIIDTHDGGEERRRRYAKQREDKVRLRAQLETLMFGAPESVRLEARDIAGLHFTRDDRPRWARLMQDEPVVLDLLDLHRKWIEEDDRDIRDIIRLLN